MGGAGATGDDVSPDSWFDTTADQSGTETTPPLHGDAYRLHPRDTDARAGKRGPPIPGVAQRWSSGQITRRMKVQILPLGLAHSFL